MKQIQLTQGRVALVDDEDYDRLIVWRWRFSPGGYAIRSTFTDGKEKLIRMHREIMQPAPGELVDHIDGDGLNNQRSNLRSVSKSVNNQNVLRIRNFTGYKGVYQEKNRFAAYIHHEGKRIRIASFRTPEEAANAYDIKALELYGEHAATNAKIKLKK